VIVVHVGHENQSGKSVLLAQLPCLLRAYLDAGLAVHDDDRRVRNADGLLDLSDKVEVAGRI